MFDHFISDFLILSIHDLQLGDSDGNNRVDKKEVAAYVFLNDKCLDCLVLGSQSAQMQDPQQSSSGGASLSNRAKKVRVSLFDTKKRLQLIVKKVGKDPV